ncbi:MAG: effector protein, partial [Pseudomonadota bacterium]
MGRLTKLFEPGRIGGLEIKNRIVMAPMVTMAYGPEGELTSRTADFYAARARGGVGLIICQSSIILWESRAPFRCSLYDDKFIPGLRMVAEAIHEHGAKAAFQIIHHGRVLTDYQALVPHPEDIRPLAPSARPRLLAADLGEFLGPGGTTIWAAGN